MSHTFYHSISVAVAVAVTASVKQIPLHCIALQFVCNVLPAILYVSRVRNAYCEYELDFLLESIHLPAIEKREN